MEVVSQNMPNVFEALKIQHGHISNEGTGTTPSTFYWVRFGTGYVKMLSSNVV